MSQKFHDGFLVFQDGSVYKGQGFGSQGLASGEMVFNTSITGYEEILTDPSYDSQIITFTHPHIGNTGINEVDAESSTMHASALVVKEPPFKPFHYRSRMSLDDYLKQIQKPGLCGLDTRALVNRIRTKGAEPALVAVGDFEERELILKAKDLKSLHGQNLAKKVSCKKSYEFKEGFLDFIATQPLKKYSYKTPIKIAAYDFGIKTNILRCFVEQGFAVTVFPYDTPAETLLSDPTIQGVFLSNGPGDPAACDFAIEQVKKILGKRPLFGICLGQQILALALNAKTYKMKFGHRGGNQPVKNLITGKVEITAQNHGFAVDTQTLPKEVTVTHINLNDQTLEGFSYPALKCFSVQYHPEASPGPHDSYYLFDEFKKYIT